MGGEYHGQLKLRNAKLLPFPGVSEFYYAMTHFDLRKGQTVAPNIVLLSLPPFLRASFSTSLWSGLQVFEKTIDSENAGSEFVMVVQWLWYQVLAVGCDTRKTAHQLPRESVSVSDLHVTPESVDANVLVMLTLHLSSALYGTLSSFRYLWGQPCEPDSITVTAQRTYVLEALKSLLLIPSLYPSPALFPPKFTS